MAKTIAPNTLETAYQRYQHDDGKYYSYPQPAGAPNWNTLLARTGTGTPDPSFDPKTDITYLGSFRIPFLSANGITSRDKHCLAYCPPNGSNGANGSVFFGGNSSGGNRGVSEWQVPDVLSTSENYNSVPAAVNLQTWFDVFAAAPNDPSPQTDTQRTEYMGWLKVVDSKLLISFYATYSVYQNNSNLLIASNASDLAGSTYQGLINLSGADRVVRYCGDIPAEHQAAFGDTHFSGICTEISIVARSSYGHSVYSWSPADIAPSDTSAPSTPWRYYTEGSPSVWMSLDNNADISNHYAGLVGQPLADYVRINPALRLTDFSLLAQPPASYRDAMINYTSICGCAFIPPGTDTIVFIGCTSGMRYGIGYKDPTIEFGTAGYVSGGFAPWSFYDNDNSFWTVNVNDVINGSTPQSADYIEYGHFLQEPWSGILGKNTAKIYSGDFDPATRKLYLLHDGVPFSPYESQHMVSVYHVGGGS